MKRPALARRQTSGHLTKERRKRRYLLARRCHAHALEVPYTFSLCAERHILVIPAIITNKRHRIRNDDENMKRENVREQFFVSPASPLQSLRLAAPHKEIMLTQ